MTTPLPRPVAGPTHQRLRAWQEAMRLADAVRAVSDPLLDGRRAHLADQLSRAATSVHANIAEGNARWSPGDRTHFLTMALGSLAELDSLLAEAVRAAPALAAPATACTTHARHTARLLTALIRTQRTRKPP